MTTRQSTGAKYFSFLAILVLASGVLSGCASDNECTADSPCDDRILGDTDPSDSPDGDLGKTCTAACGNLHGRCNFSFGPNDNFDTCLKSCNQGAFTDEEAACLAIAECGDINIATCLDQEAE